MAISDHPLTPVGKLLEDTRRARGWSHLEVTQRAGVQSPSTWNVVIYGGREDKGQFKQIHATAATLARYAMALGLNVRTVLKTAGFKDVPKNIKYHLVFVPTEQLLAELRRRNELPSGGELGEPGK